MLHKYILPLRILHWLMAFSLIAMVTGGFLMTEIPSDNEMRITIYNLHKSFGVLLFFLVALRLSLRLFSKLPKLPNEISSIEQKLAKLGHYALYFVMFAMPISGYLMSCYYGIGVKFFGISLPNFLPINVDNAMLAKEMHEIFADLLIILVIIHILAVVKHFKKDKVNLLKRIT
jgi:cytochrome b561